MICLWTWIVIFLHLEANGKAGGSRQGKSKLNMDCKYADFGNSLVPHKGFDYEYSSCAGEDVHDELNGLVSYIYFFLGWPGLTRVNPSDPWPDHLTGSMTGSGFKTMVKSVLFFFFEVMNLWNKISICIIVFQYMFCWV
jgi:hypothetical protein